MIDVVINYDPEEDLYKLFEPTTDTIIMTKDLNELFCNLSDFLKLAGLVSTELLDTLDILYHLDSFTLRKMIESNVNLMKRLNTAPSGFMMSSLRFGGSSVLKKKEQSSNFSGGNEKSKKRTSSYRSSGFGGKSGFACSYKKFGTESY